MKLTKRKENLVKFAREVTAGTVPAKANRKYLRRKNASREKTEYEDGGGKRKKKGTAMVEKKNTEKRNCSWGG